MILRPIVLALLLTFLPAFAGAGASPGAAADGEAPARAPHVALVLAGGGARGAVHVGVLKALEEMRVPVDLIVGTSMGAVVGGLYSSGMSPEGIASHLGQADWDDIFSSRVPRADVAFRQKQDETLFATRRDLGIKGGRVLMPRGLVVDQKLQFLLREMTAGGAGEEYDHLPIPFRAVATDLVTGEAVVLAQGDLAEAMRASMSVPGVFSPVEWEGRLLVDGGVVDNLPVDVALALGADVVIAVDVPVRPMARGELESVVGVSSRTLDIYTRENVARRLSSLRPGDILITPDPGDAFGTEFSRAIEIAGAGEKAAFARSADLARLALSPGEYRRRREARPTRPRWFDQPLAFVRVEGPPFMAPEVLARQVRARAGERLDLAQLREDLLRLYGTGDFELVNFALEKGASQDGAAGTGLVVHAREKAWGPDYLGLGLSLSDDFAGESSWQIAAGYTRTWLNPLGGEWKNEVGLGRDQRFASEFHQPLESSQTLFLAPHLEYRLDQLDLFSGDDRVAVYGVRTVEAGVDFGAELGTLGEARLGVWRSRATSNLRVGTPSSPEFAVSRGGYRLSLAYDGMDRPFFPGGGTAAEFTLSLVRPELGADFEYDKALFRARQAFSSGHFAVVLSAELGSAADTEVPFDDQFTLGGFLRLSGLRETQLRGPYLALGRIVFTHRALSLPPSLGGGVYTGLSLEGGNVWQRREEMSPSGIRLAGCLFLGAELALGPAYLAWGHADSGENAYYLSLGRAF